MVNITGLLKERELTPPLNAKNLVQSKHGIWNSPQTGSVSYPEGRHLENFELEDDSFWFNHRNDCILSVIKKHPPNGPILDIGGGNGFVARRLIDEGFETILLEPGPIGALHAKKQRAVPNVICSTLDDAGFQAESIEAVGLFDVLEHLENDRQMLSSVYSLLKPNGIVYGTVPAHNRLWSLSDEIAGHFRRYDQASVMELLSGKFDLLYFTYYMRILYLPVILFRTLPYKLKLVNNKNVLSSKIEHGQKAGFMVSLLRVFLTRELGLINRGNRIPLGTSCLFAAQKSSRT